MPTARPHTLRDRLNELRANRRAQKKVLGRKNRRALNRSERATILSFTDGKCHICGGDVGEKWQADHVRAHSAGGKHSLDNFLAAHPSCNNYKWDYLPEEIQIIQRLGVWAKTQIERGTRIGGEIEDRFSKYEAHKNSRRASNRTGGT